MEKYKIIKVKYCFSFKCLSLCALCLMATFPTLANTNISIMNWMSQHVTDYSTLYPVGQVFAFSSKCSFFSSHFCWFSHMEPSLLLYKYAIMCIISTMLHWNCPLAIFFIILAVKHDTHSFLMWLAWCCAWVG